MITGVDAENFRIDGRPVNIPSIQQEVSRKITGGNAHRMYQKVSHLRYIAHALSDPKPDDGPELMNQLYSMARESLIGLGYNWF